MIQSPKLTTDESIELLNGIIINFLYINNTTALATHQVIKIEFLVKRHRTRISYLNMNALTSKAMVHKFYYLMLNFNSIQ